jgi:hypothetical protein
MKLLNIFKKEQKTASIKVQKLEKNQLEKVIGGGDSTRLKEEIKKLTR